MQISDEAVEAAYSAINYPGQQAIDRDEIRIILEAAAPRIVAQAWDEGLIAGYAQKLTKDNPYRS